jgi:hypothetical protein
MTCTICGASKFSVVKDTLIGLTVPSAGLLLESAMTTGAVGSRFNTMLKVALAPCSVVTSPSVGITTTSPCIPEPEPPLPLPPLPVALGSYLKSPSRLLQPASPSAQLATSAESKRCVNIKTCPRCPRWPGRRTVSG